MNNFFVVNACNALTNNYIIISLHKLTQLNNYIFLLLQEFIEIERFIIIERAQLTCHALLDSDFQTKVKLLNTCTLHRYVCIEPRAPMTKSIIYFIERKFYAKWVDTNQDKFLKRVAMYNVTFTSTPGAQANVRFLGLLQSSLRVLGLLSRSA